MATVEAVAAAEGRQGVSIRAHSRPFTKDVCRAESARSAVRAARVAAWATQRTR